MRFYDASSITIHDYELSNIRIRILRQVESNVSKLVWFLNLVKILLFLSLVKVSV